MFKDTDIYDSYFQTPKLVNKMVYRYLYAEDILNLPTVPSSNPVNTSQISQKPTTSSTAPDTTTTSQPPETSKASEGAPNIFASSDQVELKKQSEISTTSSNSIAMNKT
jgi:hypothetical protein